MLGAMLAGAELSSDVEAAGFCSEHPTMAKLTIRPEMHIRSFIVLAYVGRAHRQVSHTRRNTHQFVGGDG